MATPPAPTPPSPTRDQLDAIAELTNLMKELSDSSKKLTSDFELQANALNKVCDALKCVKDNSKVTTQLIIDSRNLTGATGGLTAAQIALAKQLRDSQNAAAGASDEHRRASEELQKHAKSSKLLGAAIGGVTGFFSGLLKGLQSLLAMTKAIFGFFIGLADAVWNVGKAIISIPFKMLDALIAKADEGGNSISELAAAANRMREVFGTLSGPTNKAIVATATAMNNLKLAGVSTFQVFGTVAERQEALIDLFDQGGPSLRLFTKEIIESNGAILGFQKGLGLTNEDLGKFATIAKSSGRPVNKVLTEITKYADNMAKHFELDIKKVSREMAKAAGDFKNFGNISEKQLSIAVTYAQKLGLSLDKITGTMDAFGDFDTAADNVSKLNEAFGTNIDAMEILQAQTPHEKMDILRRSMRGVGVEGEKLNAAQRKLITGATGIDDETAVLALSTKNYGVSLKEIEKQASKTQKKTMTQAEAMEKLSDSMARMAKAAEALTGGGGLFGSLMNGFMKGVEGSKEFQAMMTSLKGVILKVFEVGRNLGRVFVTSFPGVNKVFGALADFAKKIAPMFDRMNKVITEFIEGLTKPGGEASFSTLMTKLKDIFFQYFNKDAPEGKRLLEGFKEFGAAVFEIFSQMAVWVIEKMSEAIDYIADWISNPQLPNVDASGAGAVFMNSLNRILEVVQNKLGPALMKLGGVIWDKLKEALSDPENQKYIKYALMGIGGLILAPAIIQGIAGAFAGGQLQGMISGAGGSGGIFGSLTGALTQQGQAAARGGGPGAPGAGAAPIPPPPPAPPPIPPLPIPSPTDIRNMEGAADSKVDWNKLSSFMLSLAALFAVGGGVYMMFKNVVEFVKTVDIIDIVKAGVAMYVIGITVEKMAEAVRIMNVPFLGKVDMASISKLMVAMSVMMVTGLISFSLATKVVAGVSIVDIIKAGIAMAEIAALMYAVAPLMKAAQMVGSAISGKEVETRKALIGMGLVMLEIAGVALVVISALGGFTVEQTGRAVAAAGGVGTLMAGAGVLLYEAAILGKALDKMDPISVISALGSMGGLVIIVAALAKFLITGLGDFSIDKIGRTVAAMAGVGILFAASGLLLVEAAALGAATGGTGGVGVGAVITGLVGMIAVIAIVGLAAYALISNFGEFSMDKVGVTIAAMVGTGLLFAGAGALLAEAAAVGAGFAAAGFAAAGMIAMGLAIATVAETALVLIEQFGNIPKTKVDTTLKMMQGTVNLYSAAGDLVKQAREIAKGIGLNDYLVILEGIRTIEGVVINICDMVLKVVKEIAQIKEKPEELSRKTENFTKIVDSMANFVKTLAELSKMIEPGFFESTSSVERRFNKVIELISVIVEGKRGGGGVIGIINAVTRAVTSVSKESLEKGKAFAEIISATARLVDSMTKPVTELNKNAVAAGEGAAKGQLISAQAIGNMADFIDRVTPQIKWLVSSLIGALTGLSKRELEKLEKGGPAIAGVLSAVAKFAEAVKPGSVSLSNIGTATGGAGGGGEGASGGEAHARAVVTINQTVPSLKDMLDALKNVIPGLMSSMIEAIQTVPSGEEFRKKIDDAIAVFGVLGPLSEAAATMVEAGKDNQGGNYDPSPVTNTLNKLQTFFKSMLGYTKTTGLGETSLIDVLYTIKRISESPMFSIDYTKITGDISGSMSSMVNAANGVKDSIANYNITEADVKKIKDKMTDMYNFFDDLRSEEENTTSLRNLSNVVSKLSESVGQNQTAVSGSASSLTEFFSTFDQIVQGIVGFAGYADPISKAKTSIKDMSDSFGAIVGGVGSLFFNVAQIQKLFVTLIEGGADTSIDSLSENMLRIGDKFNTYIKSNQVFLSKVNEGAESLKKMADVLTITVAAGLLPAVKAADDMIMAGKMIEEKLNQGAKFDIDAKLQAFADNFGQGVGMGAAYTVKGKDVNVDLTVKIVIDPTELERIMVTRASSPLKQRINLLLEAVSGNVNAKNNALAAKIYPGTQPTQMSY